MLTVMLCLFGILTILLLNEFLWRRKILKGELRRKFVHIASAAFIAFWPWLVSWQVIRLIGLAMLIVLLLNRQYKVLHYLGDIRKDSYGDFFLALAVIACASLTDSNVFFALAMLHVALADGLAAIIGTKFGQKWRYEVFGQRKTVIGSMTFWLVSIWLLGVGLLFAYATVPFPSYAKIIVFLPPVLTALENISVKGSDNLVLPIAVVAVLESVQTAI